MRILIAIALTVVSTSSYAQSVDCKALKDTTVPVQISWHVGNESRITQVYRDDSGDYVCLVYILFRNIEGDVRERPFDPDGDNDAQVWSIEISHCRSDNRGIA
jgi:hypothetical protein